MNSQENMNKHSKFLNNYLNVQSQTPFLIQMPDFPNAKMLEKSWQLIWNGANVPHIYELPMNIYIFPKP